MQHSFPALPGEENAIGVWRKLANAGPKRFPRQRSSAPQLREEKGDFLIDVRFSDEFPHDLAEAPLAVELPVRGVALILPNLTLHDKIEGCNQLIICV